MSAIGIRGDEQGDLDSESYKITGLIPGIAVIGSLILISISLCIWRKRSSIREALKRNRAAAAVANPSAVPVFTVQLQKAEAARKVADAARSASASASSIASNKRRRAPRPLDLEKGSERLPSTSSTATVDSPIDPEKEEAPASAMRTALKEIVVFATAVPSPTPSPRSNAHDPIMLPAAPPRLVRKPTAPLPELSRVVIPPPRITLRKATEPFDHAQPPSRKPTLPHLPFQSSTPPGTPPPMP